MPSVLLRPSRHGLRNRRKGKGTKNLVTTHLKIKVAVVPSDDDSQIMVISSWLGSHKKNMLLRAIQVAGEYKGPMTIFLLIAQERTQRQHEQQAGKHKIY